ncbi:DUF5977 domain-containing protein [Flavihumibacter sp. CACIAM 22H1]|uniref:DUF5977 domain-containing protein n=1 Tax=Flavihumibacter sp. CACIAM 22H1 TaxID=1812911 RepID=UPI0025C57D01|nr:DUF5977 domain-containing protein [Flavihumibacter sp. CACIAM 22H1]
MGQQITLRFQPIPDIQLTILNPTALITVSEKKSGKFIYSQSSGFTTIPFDPVKISFQGVYNNISFSTVDDVGTIYQFEQTSQTTTSFDQANFSPSHVTTNAWHLTRMISADLVDTISFEYESAFFYESTNQEVYSIGIVGVLDGPNVSFIQQNGGSSSSTAVSYTNNSVSHEKQLKKIVFSGGYVLLNRQVNRQDISGSSSGKMLNNIEVYNSDNKLIKKTQFSYSYFPSVETGTSWDYKRLKLDKVEDISGDGQSSQVYQLGYNSTMLPKYGSYAMDYWGYYNGSSNTSLIPATTVTSGDLNNNSFSNGETYSNGYINNTTTWSFGSANREPSEIHMKAALLNRITFPTGGYTEFDFEAHQYNSTYNGSNAVKIGAGLRIKSLKSFNATGELAFEETYKYGLNESGVGVKLFDENSFYKNYEDVVSSYFTGTVSDPSSICVNKGTRWVRKYMGFAKYNSFAYMGSPVLYPQVVKFTGNATINNGKQVSEFTIHTDFINLPNEFINSGNYGSINNAWKQGELTKETFFKKTSSGYEIIKATEYQYQNFNNVTRYGIMLKQHKQFVNLTGCATSGNGPDVGNSRYGNGFFVIYQYPIKSGVSKLIKKIETVYEGNQTIQTVSDYSYENPAHMLLTKSKTTKSESDQYSINQTKYPNDISSTISTGMVNKNMISFPLEENLFIETGGVSKLLQKTSTNYKLVGSGYKLDNVLYSTLANAPEERIKYVAYDGKSNILQQIGPDGLSRSYIWGYNTQYPIAEVINALPGNIFHSSFEDTDGNSLVGDAKAGRRSRTGGYVKALTGLSNGQYKLSYWQKSSGVWSLQQTTVTVSSGTYTISLTGQVDDVRFHPIAAQMTTYTYSPLIGITTSCDVNNNYSFYEYDGFNRLYLVRDKDGNVLKKFCYNYAGQPISCDIFTNDDKSGSYTRTNCGSGYTGGTVTVSVPAGMFSSTISKADANSQATAYGQAQANSLGTCTASNVSILCNNNVSMGTVYMQYHNNTTGQMYTFNVSAAGSNINLGTIPAGTYTVSIGTSNNTTSYYFTVACGYYLYGTNATFNNVTVDNTCRVISISPY